MKPEWLYPAVLLREHVEPETAGKAVLTRPCTAELLHQLSVDPLIS